MRNAIFVTITLVLLGTVGYVYWFYYSSYSDGNRGGVLQKFSRKGNLFKTYEGELLMRGFGQKSGGFNAQYFYFSVSDIALADSLSKCIDKKVTLHYIQYRRHLPWRGDNYNGKNDENGQYIVDKIISVEEVQEGRFALGQE